MAVRLLESGVQRDAGTPGLHYEGAAPHTSATDILLDDFIFHGVHATERLKGTIVHADITLLHGVVNGSEMIQEKGIDQFIVAKRSLLCPTRLDDFLLPLLWYGALNRDFHILELSSILE